MTGVSEFLWYALWFVALAAFAILWLATANILFNAFRVLFKSHERGVASIKKSVEAAKQKTAEGGKLAPQRIRTVSGLVFVVCFVIILCINVGRSA
jgi:hypothetical protein